MDPSHVHQVLKWIVSGASESDIAEAIKEKFPDAAAAPIIIAAVAQLEAQGAPNASLIDGWCIEAYRELYRRMVEIADYAGALRAVKAIHGMAGSR